MKQHNECDGCSHCCSHTKFQINPNSVAVAKHWGSTVVYKSEDDPWVDVYNPCQHLKEDGYCDDYSNRPEICKRFPHEYNKLYAPYCKLMRTKYDETK